MKVFYRKGEHIIISFPSNELGHALKVLKALAKAFGAPFILTAAKELEDDLRPRLTYDHGYRLCESCKCEINIRKDAYVHRNDRYIHQTCPVLKERTQ